MSIENRELDSVWGNSEWIQSSIYGTPKFSPPVPVFRRRFSLSSPIKTASLTISALGLWDGQINGKPITDSKLNPGWTDYRKRLYFRTFKADHLLVQGENELKIHLGDGWFVGRVAHLDRGFYGDQPSLRFHLKIEFEDGCIQTVNSDEETEWTTSQILRSDLLDGETVDARRTLSNWQPAQTSKPYEGVLEPHPGEPIIISEEIAPISGPTEVTGSWGQKAFVYDFGQNFAGIIRMKIKAEVGTTFKLRYAEMLNPNGTVYTANLRSALVTDYYTCVGGGDWEFFEPKFTFHGFRYLEISLHENAYSKCESFDTETVRGLVLHTKIEPNSTFECDHPLLNQLWKNIDWGLRSNFLEIPTDCPQRDERLGWTGDIQVFGRTALIHRKVTPFLHKWLTDLVDSQAEDGSIPMVAPTINTPPIPTSDGGAGWADAMVVVPHEMELATGYEISETYRDAIWRWFEFLKSTSKEGVRAFEGCGYFQGFGDWVALDDPDQPYHGGTPRDLIATAYFARSAGLTAHFWHCDPDRCEDALQTQKLAKEAFVREFWTADRLKKETQTGYLLALNDIFEPSDPKYSLAAEGLVRKLEENYFKLNTGFLGTPLLCPTLVKIGRSDLAMKILLNEDYPGWFFSIKNGATTTWERWNSYTSEGFGDVNMNSFNHYAYGSIGAFIMEYVAGIQIDKSIRPIVGHGINQVKAEREFCDGEKISIHWSSAPNETTFKIEIEGIKSVPFVLDNFERTLGQGLHEFSLPR